MPRGFVAESRGVADQLYQSALRHSRHVRALRIGVPAALFAALLLIVGANYAPMGKRLQLPGELRKLVIKGTKVTMQQPRLTGFTNDSRPYEFGADFAEQDITKPDLMKQDRARRQKHSLSFIQHGCRRGLCWNSVTRSPAFREYPVKQRDQLADRWA